VTEPELLGRPVAAQVEEWLPIWLPVVRNGAMLKAAVGDEKHVCPGQVPYSMVGLPGFEPGTS